MNNNIQNSLIVSLMQSKGIHEVTCINPYPCGICQKNVNNNQKAIECTSCNLWIHIKCDGTTIDEYNRILENNSLLTAEEICSPEWECNKCKIYKMATIFPFGLEDNHELLNIVNTDSIKSLDYLPSYEIVSKAHNIEALNQFDVDANIINKITSQYYLAHEFKALKKSESFTILHSNLNGLENKLDEYQNFINSSVCDIDVLCISETSQKENTHFNVNITIDGYRQPFTLGSKTSRGGVAIYVKNDIDVVERNDLNLINKSFEIVWVEIRNDKHKNIVCGCLYRHPNSDIDEFMKYIAKCLTKVNKEKKECYLSGDFNIDLLKYDSNNKYAEFLNTMTSFGFLPHILQPTRISDFSSTIIDNIYSNNLEQDSYSGNILIKFADHFSQFLSVNKAIMKFKPKSIYKRDYANYKEESFIEDVNIQTWNTNVQSDTNYKFNDFYWRLEGCIDRHAPLKKLNKKQLNKLSKPWINNSILKMIKHRDRLFQKKKDDPSNSQIEGTYKLFRNRITREIKKAKKEYFKQFFEDNLNNMKKTWQGIKKLINLNYNSSHHITQLYHKGKYINTNLGMANTFNSFFTNIGSELDSEIPITQKPGGSKCYLGPRIPYSFFTAPTNPKEICDLINTLDENKSSGPCTIPTKLLKVASKELSLTFSDICNTSFSEGIFPDKNKIAKVIPSHKKGPTNDVNNYRPISLLSTFSKIMEKLMAVRLNNYLDLHNIIYPNQFGFRSGYSTTHSLITITENIKKNSR